MRACLVLWLHLLGWSVFKAKKKKGISLDTTSVHLGLPVLAVWLSLCIVGQEEEPLQLGAADIVLMSWSRNGSY